LPVFPAEARRALDGPERYNQLLQEHVATVAERIVHVHVHDVRYPEWRDHAALGTGILDLVPVLEILASHDYKGLLSFELEEPAPETLAVSREVLVGLLQSVAGA